VEGAVGEDSKGGIFKDGSDAAVGGVRMQGEERPMPNCPQCGRSLTTLSPSHTSFDLCQSCNVLWFDYGELGEELSKISGQEISATDLRLNFHPLSEPDERPCPRCGTPTLVRGAIAGCPLSKCGTCSGLLVGLDDISACHTTEFDDVKRMFLNFIEIIRYL